MNNNGKTKDELLVMLHKLQLENDSFKNSYEDISNFEQIKGDLLASEIRYRRLFESAKDGIIILDAETGKIVDVNPFLIDLLGYSHTEFIEKFIWEIGSFKDILSNKDKFSELIQKEYVRYNSLPIENKDGGKIHVEFVSNVYLADKKKVIQCNIRDITARIKIEKELIIAKEKAEESDRLKTAFLANMSHEIRTPMNGILGFADLLKEPDLSGEKQQEYVRVIEKSGIRMLNIINDIVSISKIESGLMEVNKKESNINEQIKEIYAFFKPEVEAKGIKFTFKNSLSFQDSIVNTDSEKLFAILTNIVKNAVKYTESGSIEFGYTKEGKFLEFYVKDTGIGIDIHRQEAIFERFIQADISDKHALQGAGLGLSISKAYVEMLGGKLWVVSEKGEGSNFYFTIPYDTNLNVSKENINGPRDGDLGIQNLKILIVEDDETSYYLMSIILAKICREFLLAKNGFEAIEVCRNNPDIDLVLMDINIPGMGGYEATRQIRKFNKNTIIIAQTAYGLKGEREIAINSGCNDYISKPIMKSELLSRINYIFKTHTM